MPSTFPEAFGMVAAEAAACGALPLSAAHSGHGRGHRHARPGAASPSCGRCCRSSVGPGAVEQIAAKLVTWLTLDPAERERASAALAAEAARALSLGERGGGRHRRGPGAAGRAAAIRLRQRIMFPPREPRPEPARPLLAALSPAPSRCRSAAAGATSPTSSTARRFHPEVRLLPRAGPGRHAGRHGPNLDAAFGPARTTVSARDGRGRGPEQIADPRRNSMMPADLVKGGDARTWPPTWPVAGQPGRGHGELAQAGRPGATTGPADLHRRRLRRLPHVLQGRARPATSARA